MALSPLDLNENAVDIGCAGKHYEITTRDLVLAARHLADWSMGKRNPVTLVSAVVKRNSSVVTGSLCEANIPPTTISPLPMATSVIMTCKIVKVPIDIPRIIELSVIGLLVQSTCLTRLAASKKFNPCQEKGRKLPFRA